MAETARCRIRPIGETPQYITQLFNTQETFDSQTVGFANDYQKLVALLQHKNEEIKHLSSQVVEEAKGKVPITSASQIQNLQSEIQTLYKAILSKDEYALELKAEIAIQQAHVKSSQSALKVMTEGIFSLHSHPSLLTLFL